MARLLIAVEDERLLSFLSDGLAGAGHTVLRAQTVDEVFDRISEERFDLMIADIFQPVLEGVSMIATVARACPQTRLIALTDFRSARARNYELGLWTDSILGKPLSIERVRNEAEWVLQRPVSRETVPSRPA